MTTSKADAVCPQCAHPLKHNDAGAWCENYPCRWSLNRAKAVIAAKVHRKLWGPIR